MFFFAYVLCGCCIGEGSPWLGHPGWLAMCLCLLSISTCLSLFLFLWDMCSTLLLAEATREKTAVMSSGLARDPAFPSNQLDRRSPGPEQLQEMVVFFTLLNKTNVYLLPTDFYNHIFKVFFHTYCVRPLSSHFSTILNY